MLMHFRLEKILEEAGKKYWHELDHDQMELYKTIKQEIQFKTELLRQIAVHDRDLV
jgi:hypothetical protein